MPNEVFPSALCLRGATSINSFVHLNAAAAGFGEIFAVTADAGLGTGIIT